MKIREVMTRNVSFCKMDDSLTRAAQLMWEGDCGSVPVVDAAGTVRGMITDRDICMAAYTQGLALNRIQVHSAMSPRVHSCAPEDTIEEVHALMQRHKVRRAPVLEDGRLVGVVSLGDFFVHASAAPREPGLGKDRLVETIAVISAPNGNGGASRSMSTS